MTEDSEKEPAPTDDAAPLDELAREVRERNANRENERASEREAVFEQVDVDTIDRERLWEDLLTDSADNDVDATASVGQVEQTGRAETPPSADAEAAPSVDSETPSMVEEVESPSDVTEHVVPKREYCQRCPHFSAPPDATCTHDGTDIVEVVSVGEFRVRNCPMVDD
ncbi:hypothetical protein [Halogranum rubrum]|uniref:DUF8135 domain-containing protein n=1 Tax=Halogranum salarium B-1 TaxID=1210908 RepID=J3JEQ1_9EURY|nr:hypothetical protein [Halogranum salarium]EJN58561.1 hypothetical protein HSB1_30390 [Halogranum salarium B-1]